MVACRCSNGHVFHKNTRNISFMAYLWRRGGAAGSKAESIMWIVDIYGSGRVH